MSAGRLRRSTRRPVALAALLILCLLPLLSSLRHDLVPPTAAGQLPPLTAEAIPLALAALAAASIALARQATWPRGRLRGASCLAGLGLFAAPALLACLPSAWAPPLARVALLSLVPVFAVVFEPYIDGAGGQRQGALAAALAAALGTLCVFPVSIPSSMPAAGAWCVIVAAAACVAAANCRAVALCAMWPERSIAPAAAMACASAAAAVAAAGALTERSRWAWSGLTTELAWAGAVEAPGLLLLFWLMRRMPAVQTTARFVLTPLFSAVAGLILLRAAAGLRGWMGLALMAGGAGWLLFAPGETPDSASLPVHFNRL